jgi:hypothetical protein
MLLFSILILYSQFKSNLGGYNENLTCKFIVDGREKSLIIFAFLRRRTFHGQRATELNPSRTFYSFLAESLNCSLPGLPDTSPANNPCNVRCLYKNTDSIEIETDA